MPTIQDHDQDPVRGDQDALVDPIDRAIDGASFSGRTGPSRLRIGVVSGAAVALAIGAVATSMAATPPVTGTTGATGTTSMPALYAAGSAAAELDAAFEHGRMGGMAHREITIESISGTSVALKTDDGWARTITVTDAVDLTKGGQEIALSDLVVGDQVRIGQTRADDGTWTVDALVVVVPSAGGTVSDVSPTGFKLTGRDDSVWTITVDGSTQYQYGTGTGSLADVTNGETVLVLGTSTGDNALTALTVRVSPDRAMGTVASKTADTIVVTQRDGGSLTVRVDADTAYRVEGADSGSLADVTVGMTIGVSGRDQEDGSIDADLVVAGEGRGQGDDNGRGGRGGGGRGGFGPGADGPDGSDDAAPSAAPTTAS